MLVELDQLLKQGHINEVQKRLEDINISKLPREKVLPLANIARRAGFHRLAFKVINLAIRPKNKLKSGKTSAEELCEYAMILFRLGVIHESRNILSSPDVKTCPQRLLYLAFILFSEWDYQKACELLELYIPLPNVDHYNRAVAKINLAQSYIATEQPIKAIKIIEVVLTEAKKENWRLLHANALQNLADAYLDRRDFNKVQKPLKEIKKLIGDSHYRYSLYVKRVLACLKLPDVKMLRELSAEAYKKRQYELFRECNFIEAVATNNKELLKKVYFGTPYPEYRKRILRVWGKPIDLEKHYLWDLNPKKKSTHVFDVSNGQVVGTSVQIKRGTAVHRLIAIFAGNLYKTFKTEALFSLLFPDEFFQPTVSINKIYQLIGRTRQWLAKNNIGFTIDEDHGEYFLSSERGYTLKISDQVHNPKNIGDQQLSRLREMVGFNTYFTVGIVKAKLNVATATANRILKKAVEDKVLVKIGHGKTTEYLFSASKNK